MAGAYVDQLRASIGARSLAHAHSRVSSRPSERGCLDHEEEIERSIGAAGTYTKGEGFRTAPSTFVQILFRFLYLFRPVLPISLIQTRSITIHAFFIRLSDSLAVDASVEPAMRWRAPISNHRERAPSLASSPVRVLVWVAVSLDSPVPSSSSSPTHPRPRPRPRPHSLARQRDSRRVDIIYFESERASPLSLALHRLRLHTYTRTQVNVHAFRFKILRSMFRMGNRKGSSRCGAERAKRGRLASFAPGMPLSISFRSFSFFSLSIFHYLAVLRPHLPCTREIEPLPPTRM